MPSIDRRQFLTKGAAVLALPLIAPAIARAETQSSWRFCDKCFNLFFDGYADKGRCPAGGGHRAQGYDFNLTWSPRPSETPSVQMNWRYCDKCHVMFFDGFPTKGRCAAGGGHNAQGYVFTLLHDRPASGSQQDRWRYCGKCFAMFFDGYPTKGSCPAGGGHAAQGYMFVLPFIQPKAAPPPPPSQMGGFRRVATEPWGGALAVINRVKLLQNPVLPREVAADFGPLIRGAWQRARPRLTDDVIRAMNERDIGSGFRTSRTALNLAQDGDLYVGTDGTGVTIRFVLRGNSVETSIRVPGPTPSGTDPRFNVKFDIDVNMEVERSGITMSAGPARLSLNVGRPTGANLTGDIAIAAANLVKLLSGQDFIRDGLNAVNGRDFALNAPINFELGKMLGGRVGRGIAIGPGFDRRYGRVTLTLEDEGSYPVVR